MPELLGEPVTRLQEVLAVPQTTPPALMAVPPQTTSSQGRAVGVVLELWPQPEAKTEPVRRAEAEAEAAQCPPREPLQLAVPEATGSSSSSATRRK